MLKFLAPSRVYISEICGQIGLAANLCQRAFRDGQEVGEPSWAVSFESLCDIRNYRNRRALNLPTEAEVLTKRRNGSQSIDLPSQYPRILPSNKALKAPNLPDACHTPPSILQSSAGDGA